MNKLFTFCVLVFTLQINLFSQPCLPEGITFNMQDEIDNFLTNHPECTEIEGDVNITGINITNLDGLSVLNSIGGTLIISKNEGLANILGLENLTYIGGTLHIFLNSGMTSIDGLNNLVTIEGDVSVNRNDSLIGLTGLNHLSVIGGDLSIFHNDVLKSITGLNNLSSIGGTLLVNDNKDLINLVGLNNLISINGSLRIENNFALVNLPGDNNITTIGNDLRIINDSSLTNLHGLQKLISIGGSIYMHGNNLVTSLDGLDNIDPVKIKNLAIYLNNALSSCSVKSICDYLADPKGIIKIYGNAQGCNNPIEVADACGIELTCFPYGDYYFNDQTMIDDFQVNFPGCTELKGSVIIRGENITNLNGLNVITSIEESLVIMGNNMLTNLGGLDNLILIGGFLNIERNDALCNLINLSELTSTGKQILIWGNNSLTSLSGLDNIDPTKIKYLYIYENPLLSICGIESICNCLDNLDDIVIYGNANGCANQIELNSACDTTLVPEIEHELVYSIFPNPLESGAVISYSLLNISHVTLKIHDLNGHEMVTLVNEYQHQGEQKVIFDGTNMYAGIYLCELKTDRTSSVIKIIKLK